MCIYALLSLSLALFRNAKLVIELAVVYALVLSNNPMVVA